MKRRNLLIGLGLIAAPAVLRLGVHMPVNAKALSGLPEPYRHYVLTENGCRPVSDELEETMRRNPCREIHSEAEWAAMEELHIRSLAEWNKIVFPPHPRIPRRPARFS